MARPDQCFFAKTHEWISIEGEVGLVGISDHAQQEITDVVFVELPEVGRRVKQAEACAVVESVKAAFDVYAPVSGVVSEVNEAIAKEPALVNQSPYEKGWFFKLRPADPAETGKLMNHARYRDFIKTPH